MAKRKRDTITVPESSNSDRKLASHGDGSTKSSKPVPKQNPSSKKEIPSDNESEDDDDDSSDSEDGSADEDEDEDENQDQDADAAEDEADQEDGKKKAFKDKTISLQEVQAAREAPELFKSSLFKLKIDEMIKTVKINDKSTKKMEKILFKINSLIKSVPGTDKYTLDEAEEVIRESVTKISIPFSNPKPARDIKYSFQYLPPVSVNVVGGFSLKTAIRQPEGNVIDMIAVIPKDLIESKDHLNYRYLHKRAFYIAYMIRELQVRVAKEGLPFVFSYKYLNDDPLKPVIRVTSSQGKSDYHFGGTKFSIQILVALPSSAFDYKKLAADKNAIRVQLPASEENLTMPATPLYNFSILTDATYTVYNEFLHRTAVECESFRDACQLGRLWLFQRGFSSSPAAGGFGHFEWAMLTAILLNGTRSDTHTLLKGYSSYQLFKGVLQVLSSVNLIENGITFSAQEGQTSKFQPNSLEVPAVTDRDYFTNIFSNMSKSSYGMIRHEAAVSNDLLLDNSKDRFDFIFLRKLFVPDLRYDAYLTVELPIPDDDLSYTPFEKIRYPSYKRYFAEKLYNVLSQGYTDRAKNLHVTFKETPYWGLERRRMHEVKNGDTVTIGLLLNDQECEKSLTFGPSPEAAETKAAAAAFSKFWGNKAEIRKFKDGTLRIVVEWKPNPRRFIVSSITKYLVEEYFGSETASTLNFANQRLLDLLKTPNTPLANSLPINSNVLFRVKNDSFLALTKQLSDLNLDISMIISRVSPTTPSLRDSSIIAPSPYDTVGDDCIGWGVIEFETSQKWPETIRAIEETKTAFLLKISEALDGSGGYKACVGTDEGLIMRNDKIRFLQVITPEGFIFRLRLKTEVDEFHYGEFDKLTKTTSYLAQYNRLYSGAITHTRTVQSLSRRFPFYSTAVRLLKTWFNTHLLTSQISQELIELLALKPFLDSAPYVPPSSPISAFCRSLEFIATWNWRDEPLILDVNRVADKDFDKQLDLFTKTSTVEGVQMENKKYLQLLETFNTLRKSDPSMSHATLFVGTHDDETGIRWSQNIPASPISIVSSSRMTGLARAALNVFTSPRFSEEVKIAQIFKPSLSDYDIVLHVRDPQYGKNKNSQGSTEDARLAKKRKTGSGGYRNLQLVTSFPKNDDLISKLNHPIQLFYEDLVEKYKDSAIFFHGNLDGSSAPSLIAGIWQQGITEPRAFKVNLNYSSIPVSALSEGQAANARGSKSNGKTKNGKSNASSNLVVLNKQAVMEEMEQLGGELIEEIQLKM